MQDKWNVKNNKKGYLKIHIAVNIKSKKILSIRVTDEHVHDSKALPELVDDVIKSDNIMAIGKLLVLMVPMMVMRFLDILETMESCPVLK
jgi:Transposase DDE domain